MSSRSLALRTLAALALLILGAAPVGAATYTWNNAGGGSWSTAANWTPSGVPAAGGDVAVLPALAGAYEVSLDTNPAIAQLQLAAGSTLDAGANSLGGVGLVTNAGTLRNVRGAYDDSRYLNLSGGTVEIAANDSIVVSDSLVNDGTIVVGATSRVHLAALTVFSGDGTLVLVPGAQVRCPIDRPCYPYWLVNDWNHVIRAAADVWVPVKNRGRIIQDAEFGSRLDLHCFVYNWGSLEVANGAMFNLDSPALKQVAGGRIIGTNGTFSMDLTSGNIGGIDNLTGGYYVAKDGDLTLSCGSSPGGHFQRQGGTGSIILNKYIVPQNMIVDEGADVVIDGIMDLMADESMFENNGTVRVRGSLNVAGPDYVNIQIQGSGNIVLEGGTIGTPGGALLTLAEGSTITGCGTISANLVNNGTIDVDCPEIRTQTWKNWSVKNRGIVRVLGGGLALKGVRVVNTGTIDGGAGAVRMEGGASIANTGGHLIAGANHFILGRAGTVSSITGGSLESSSKGRYLSAGQVTLSGVTLAPEASLATVAGATTRATGAAFTNRGVNEVEAGGKFIADAATDYLQESGATILSGGTLTVPRGFRVGGELSGRGIVVGKVTNAGSVRPAISPEGLAVQGDFMQLASGRLDIALAGDDAGTFARLAVSGTATLGGTVSVITADGFSPVSGQDFEVMGFGARAGQFAGVTAEAAMMLEPVYGPGSLTLAAQSTVGVPDPRALPTAIRFAPRSTGFVLELPAGADVDARVYDVRGREVAVLATGSHAAGVHPLPLPAGVSLSSGIYFARARLAIDGRSEVHTARLALVR